MRMEMRMMLGLKSSRSTFNLLSLSWKLIIHYLIPFPARWERMFCTVESYRVCTITLTLTYA